MFLLAITSEVSLYSDTSNYLLDFVPKCYNLSHKAQYARRIRRKPQGTQRELLVENSDFLRVPLSFYWSFLRCRAP